MSASVRIAPSEWVEVWQIGCEGMTGVPGLLSLSGNQSIRRVVQIGGRAYRISSGDLIRAVQSSRGLNRLFSQYASAVQFHAAKLSAFNSHQMLTERLALWLLLAKSGLKDGMLPLTHAIVAKLLGVGRPSVTDCLRALQDEGCIRMTRGVVLIIDQQQLEAVCSHSHNAIVDEYDRALGKTEAA